MSSTEYRGIMISVVRAAEADGYVANLTLPLKPPSVERSVRNVPVPSTGWHRLSGSTEEELLKQARDLIDSYLQAAY